MKITEHYIKESYSSEFIGIKLPCKVTIFENTTNALVKRYESNNNVVVWRQNVGRGQYVDMKYTEYFELRYKQYQITLRLKKLKSL